MRLIIDTIRRTVQCDGDALEIQRYYPLDEEHRFIVHGLGDKGFLIEIRRGKARVQQGIVRSLSVDAGMRRNGETLPTLYEVDLDPTQPIYPLTSAVDVLLQMGIEEWQITPMCLPVLQDCVADHSKPAMASDGLIMYRDIGEEGKTFETALMSARAFRVSGATWAIRSFGGRLSHVYLWPGVEQLDNLAALTAAIEKLKY